MNYKRIYDQLINRSKTRTLTGYVEKHHIVPKCMGGCDDPSNISILLPEEHFLAHLLLVKIYPEHTGLSYAAMKMTIHPSGFRINNKKYSWLRKKLSKDASTNTKLWLQSNDHPKGMLGKKHSNETKKKQSTNIRKSFLNKGLTQKVNQFTLDDVFVKQHDSLIDAAKYINGNASNIKYTAEGKFQYAYGYKWSYDMNVSQIKDRKYVGNKGKQWINDGIKSKLINEDELIPDGWVHGRIASLQLLKPIIVYRDGIEQSQYKSISECEKKSEKDFGTKLYGTNITQVLKGKSKQYKGYTFRYK